LNIPVVTNLALSDGFVGPIAILLRSDKEILFLNLADLNSSLYVTNDVVTSMRTNLVATMTTNLAGGIVSRRTENLRTKAIAQIEVRLQTNVVVNITRNVRMDVPQITAKQLRTDLVDALIFAKTLFEN
jgi:nitrogenase subunit NifH